MKKKQELRDSARESDENAERSEAAARAAGEQVRQLRQQLEAAREEVVTTRSAVEAGDGRVVSLSEEVQALRASRNGLDQRRVELQLELAGEKLKNAFGVGGRSGLGLGLGPEFGADLGVAGEVFQRWRLAFLEGRQGAMKSESEENRGKAESYESLVQRLSEELERQGEAVNRHASLLLEREEQLDAALDRAARAHDELISMEPPSLSQAVDGVKILLRVSTGAAAAYGEQSAVTGHDAPAAGAAGDDADAVPKVWCLVRYAIASSSSSSKRRGTVTGQEQEEEADTASAENSQQQQRGREEEEAGGAPRGNVSSSEDDQPVEGDEGEQQPTASAPASPGSSQNDASATDDGAAVAAEEAQSSSNDPVREGGEDDENAGEEEDGSETSTAAGGEGVVANGDDDSDTVEVVEWRTQEDVDEWFAAQVARAIEIAEEQQQETSGGGGVDGGPAAGAMDATAVTQTPVAVAPVLPVLETPMTLQQSFGAELSRVRGNLESKLEEARAELTRNTEAYKQYRARVRAL